MSSNEWEIIKPKVNAEAEFFEILNDFGDPLEVLREAISNAIDAHATKVKIHFDVENIEGRKKLVITVEDNGEGMSYDVISTDFWGLGYSPARDRDDAIGEKGHGTKIYLRSEKIIVKTQSKNGAYLSECDYPLSALSIRKLHQPRVAKIDNYLPDGSTGTLIRIEGYNDNERSKFTQELVRDYILWFTKIGSIEREFGIDKYKNFRLEFKCLDSEDFETLKFGHIFPKPNSDIDKLFNEHGLEAADLYVKRHIWPQQRLKMHPEVKYDAVIYVEGDQAKRNYNPMIRERQRSDTGRYRVADRYGLWLCKDYIPVVRVNDWLTGFGSGSNAFVLLHGFINCQSLKLTANRGTIANTDPLILEELKSEVQQLANKVDEELRNKGLYTLRGWQEEDKTIKQEKAEFERRVKNLKGRRIAKFGDRKFVEPQNESELFGLFISIYTLHPELFEFEPLDYNTTNGIDIIARHKSANKITEGEHGYIELKYRLQTKINHAYQYLRWVVCWDFDKNVAPGSELTGIEDSDIRVLETTLDDTADPLYFLNPKRGAHKVSVIRLKELLSRKISLDFEVDI
jgi:hypothetical protein